MTKYITFLMIIASSTAYAQLDSIASPGYSDYSGPYRISFPHLDQLPPHSRNMPQDIRLAYRVADSVARHVTVHDVDVFMNTHSDSDTLRYAMKYIYLMTHYDPILFTQWKDAASSLEHYKCRPGYFQDVLSARMYSDTADGRLQSLLLNSDIIAHVTVTAIAASIDESAILARQANLVTCTIDETIKGKSIPACSSDESTAAPGAAFRQAARAGSSICFDYRDEWKRGNPFRQEQSGSKEKYAVQVGKEYIVFLQFVPIPADLKDSEKAKQNWYTIFPTLPSATATGSIFPVENGCVLDPMNDLGFGKTLSVTIWKARLRSAISVLTNPR